MNTTHILDNLMSGIQIIDLDWKFVYVNNLAAEQARLPREKLIGKTLFEVFPGLKETDFDRALRRCRGEGSPQRLEHELVYGDDSVAWFDAHVQAVPDGILITSNEITHRKKIEEELKVAKEKAEEREQNISAIYNTVGNVIFKLTVEPGEQYRFESVNEQFLKTTGLSEDSIIGQRVNDIIPEPSLTMVLENYKTAIVENRIVRWEEVSRYPTGELTGEVSIAPNYNAEGECKFLVGAVHDITQRKLAEKAVMETQRAKVVGEMASAIAHDFHNSLQSILGNLEIALMREDPARQNLERIKSIVLDAAQRARLVQRFGGNAGQFGERTLVDLNGLIQKLIKNSRHLWKDEPEKRGIELKIETDLGEIPGCDCVEGEISAVFLNILKNAIEAMPEGGTVLIQTANDSGNIRILVTDTGQGMDRDARERVFQPFFTTKGFDLGRGLGMSGAYGIINEHGGRIRVKSSEPGKGTTIEMFLPAVASVDQ